MSWPSEYSDTVLYGEREFIADSNVALRMLLGTRLDVLGTVYLNGELLSQSTEPGFANNSVTDAMLADMPAFSFKARASGSTGDPQNINPTQVTAMLDLFSATFKGLVAPPGTPTGKYLKDDGTWEQPNMNTFTTTVKGLVPPPVTSTGKILTDDGTWGPSTKGIIDPVWSTPTFGPGWIQFPASQSVAYTRVGKLAILKGLLKTSSAVAADANFIQLPSDCWPISFHTNVAAGGPSGPANIMYFSTPWFKLQTATSINNFVSIDNISFYVP